MNPVSYNNNNSNYMWLQKSNAMQAMLRKIKRNNGSVLCMSKWLDKSLAAIHLFQQVAISGNVQLGTSEDNLW